MTRKRVSVVKAKVIKRHTDYTVQIEHGNQAFRLDYSGSREECQWMARMFRIALKNHNEEILKGAQKQ